MNETHCPPSPSQPQQPPPTPTFFGLPENNHQRDQPTKFRQQKLLGINILLNTTGENEVSVII